MTRPGSAALILSIALSLGLHALLFVSMADLESEPADMSEQRYQVRLRYSHGPAQPDDARDQEPRVKVEDERQEEEKSPVQEVRQVAPKEDESEREPEPPETPSAGETTELPSAEGAQSDRIEEADTAFGEGQVAQDTVNFDEAVAGLRAEVMKHKVYPRVAKRRGTEGVVRLLLTLDARGEAIELKIIESSGSAILDKAAIALIRKVLPFEHGLGRGFSVRIPVKYELM
jgi:protein TonB